MGDLTQAVRLSMPMQSNKTRLPAVMMHAVHAAGKVICGRASLRIL